MASVAVRGGLAERVSATSYMQYIYVGGSSARECSQVSHSGLVLVIYSAALWSAGWMSGRISEWNGNESRRRCGYEDRLIIRRNCRPSGTGQVCECIPLPLLSNIYPQLHRYSTYVDFQLVFRGTLGFQQKKLI